MLAGFNDWLIEITNAPVLTWPDFGFFQALDILILAVLLYFIIGWIRRTQAWVLLRGLALIIIVALFAEVFDLLTVQWILENTLGMGLVVIVILFQPELRKALEQIGRGKYLGNLKTEGELRYTISESAADEIIEAARSLSRQLTGALIVIEHGVYLGEFEESGVSIDAVLSTQLLLNIFEKNAPLHDGAIIIRSNRIAAAGCILPLTSQMLDATLGTRHRAAVGITEVSDAKVLVVSEETGTISIVEEGIITRGVNNAQLKNFFSASEPARAKFTWFFRRRK